MYENNIKLGLGDFGISSIINSSNGKEATVISSHGDYWKVSYGEKLHEWEKLGNLDFITENNEYVKPEKGITGTLKLIENRIVLVVKEKILMKSKEKLNEEELHENKAYEILAKRYGDFAKQHSRIASQGGEDENAHANAANHYTTASQHYEGAAKNKNVEMAKFAKSHVDKAEAFRKQIKKPYYLGLNIEDSNDPSVPEHFRKKLAKIDEVKDSEHNNGLKAFKKKKEEEEKKKLDEESTSENLINYINKLKEKRNNETDAKKRKDLTNQISNAIKALDRYNARKSLKENALVKQYEQNLEKMNDHDLYDECRSAATIAIASKGRDTFKSNCCLEEARRRGKPEIYFNAVESVETD